MKLAHIAKPDRKKPAILILGSAAVCKAPAAARGYAEMLGVVLTCCGWSRRHSRAPGHNENYWEKTKEKLCKV
jgi:hypothetical protein